MICGTNKFKFFFLHKWILCFLCFIYIFTDTEFVQGKKDEQNLRMLGPQVSWGLQERQKSLNIDRNKSNLNLIHSVRCFWKLSFTVFSKVGIGITNKSLRTQWSVTWDRLPYIIIYDSQVTPETKALHTTLMERCSIENRVQCLQFSR